MAKVIVTHQSAKEPATTKKKKPEQAKTGKRYVYRLYFKTPFHLDERGTGFYQHSHHFIRSDMLSAAILSSWKLLDASLKESFFQNPPFLLSSTFPFFQLNKQFYYFLPRPVFDMAVELEPHYLAFSKPIKKVAWLESSVWNEIVKGREKNWWNKFCQHELERNPSHFIVDNAFLLPKLPSSNALPPYFKIFHYEQNLRIATNRLTNQAAAGVLFDFARVHYHKNAGLYFLVEFAEESKKQRDMFDAALHLLGDTGIGADRSSGHGLFDFEKESDNLNLMRSKQRSIALSLVSPSENDKARAKWLDDAAYDLVKRGGWIAGTGCRKKTLRMFTEGSSFARSLEGALQDVTPNAAVAEALGYSIYRDGRGFFV